MSEGRELNYQTLIAIAREYPLPFKVGKRKMIW